MRSPAAATAAEATEADPAVPTASKTSDSEKAGGEREKEEAGAPPESEDIFSRVEEERKRAGSVFAWKKAEAKKLAEEGERREKINFAKSGGFYIPNARGEQVLTVLGRLIGQPLSDRPTCFQLYSEREGNGVSTLLRHYVRRRTELLLSERAESGRDIKTRKNPPGTRSVSKKETLRADPTTFRGLYVEAPKERRRMRLLAETVAGTLGELLPGKMSLSDGKDKIERHLLKNRVAVFAIDHFERLMGPQESKLRSRWRSALLSIAETTGIPIIAAGNKKAYEATRKEHRFASRFKPVELALWDGGAQAQDLLSAYDEVLPLASEAPLTGAFDLEMLARRVSWGSEGRLAKIDALVRRAGAEAIKDGSERVEAPHFAKAEERLS